MRLLRVAVAIIAASLNALPEPARADGREELSLCQQMIDRAAPSPQFDMATTRPDDAQLQRCRQIVRDWTLRESRMSVDEHGRPIR
ncbi:MAG: hypothetical protein ACJ8EF_16515 [Bradyrhizobium sp.]|jgi:hypothetical protein